MGKMKKYLVALASFLIMICIGGVYAWSIFVPPLKAEHGLPTAHTQLIFGFTIAMFAIAMIFAGKIEKKHGPKTTALIGAALFSMGYLFASFSNGRVLILLIGIGIFSGAGISFGYVCSLATPIKWFPRYKGLITGFSVAGFGGGAILLSFLVKYFLENGLPVLTIFRIVGIGYGIVVFLSALMFSVPEEINKEPIGTSQSITGLISNSKLWALFLAMFAGTFAGLLVIGNLKPIGLFYGVNEVYATTAISFLAIGNMIGRVFWGYISDKLGGRRSIIIALLLLSFFTIMLLPGARSNIAFLFLPFLIGLGFGANFVLFATEVSHLYGVNKLGLIYPYVFLSYGLAGIIGPLVGGWFFDVMQSYTVPIILSAVICCCGAIVFTVLIPVNKES
jgi:OFA family oxalate/formate antiporter-like MFS transporter